MFTFVKIASGQIKSFICSGFMGWKKGKNNNKKVSEESSSSYISIQIVMFVLVIFIIWKQKFHMEMETFTLFAV